AAPSAERMIGSMIMVGFRGLEAPPDLLAAIRAGRVGSVILFDCDRQQGEPRNIASPSQVRALNASLQKAAGGRLLIAVDQEGGRVARLKPTRGFFPLPSAQEMGRMKSSDVRALGRKAGAQMRSLGFNVDLAPVVDVQRSPVSPGLGDMGRLFGAGPSLVAEKALAFAGGLSESGIIPALKHFPGLGSASKDSHYDLPDVTRSWDRRELLPYSAAFKNGWRGLVMVAHVYNRRLDPALPSSLSPRVVDDLLRRELGFGGVVISDDLQMGAVAGTYGIKEMARLAIDAGCDILAFGNNLRYEPDLHDLAFRAVLELYREGSVSKARLEQSWRRIEALRTGLR
ncbi:MAG: glycoside hydrolase family 3 protein, partial [Mailhella sp.]|nr:glycoside hydrolase family 3 protein [Mailhella sp.]